MKGKIDVFVYGSGTGGTISGAGRFLKEQDPKIQIVAVEPARSPVISGGERGQHQFQGMGPGFIPPNLDQSVLDRVITVYEEDAFPLGRRLAEEEGLFLGMSSGGIVLAALQIARELGPGHRVAAISPDSGARYLSTALYSPEEEDSKDDSKVGSEARAEEDSRVGSQAEADEDSRGRPEANSRHASVQRGEPAATGTVG